MTIVEALIESKASGTTYMRVAGGGGFVRWVVDFTYEFDADDLIADDWEPVETGIPKLTGGEYHAATYPECPGEDCLMCNGAACNKCGAGCWNNAPKERCEHDVMERHEDAG